MSQQKNIKNKKQDKCRCWKCGKVLLEKNKMRMCPLCIDDAKKIGVIFVPIAIGVVGFLKKNKEVILTGFKKAAKTVTDIVKK